MKGNVSKTGYKANSKDKNNDYNIIPSGNITMKNVPHNVLGIDNLGHILMMEPGKDYKFPGHSVFEIPLKQMGGEPEFDRIELMKWGKYIDDPKRREQHMRDIYWNIIDDGYTPEQGYNMMKEMGAYGSKNRGDIAKNSAVWGWDTEDVDEEKMKKWAIEHDDELEKNVKRKGGAMKNKPMTYPAFLAMGGMPMYAQTGGFVPPSDAQKVTDVPNDFQFSGTTGNKKYFVKSVQAPTAVGSTNSNTNAEAHRQFLIKQLQSGVKPEDLITAGHATAAGIQGLLSYYKPAAVYIEPKVTNTTTPQKQPIPLNESDRVEMKQMFPNTGNKYLTFQVPDANGGYNQATEKYYDPKTFRPIDPLKSFDNTGNYSPSFLYSDPNQETLAEKYRGTKIATRQDVTKIGQADSLNVNPDIQNGSKVGYQTGGPVFNKEEMAGFLDSYFKKDKDKSKTTAPQGQDTNSFVKEKQEYFMQHLRSNTMKHFISEEVGNLNSYLKCGGAYKMKAQEGLQVDLYDPNNPLAPRPENNMQDFYNGPFGGMSATVPPYVQNMQSAYPSMNVDVNSAIPSDLNLQPGADANAIAYQKYLEDWKNKNKKAQNKSNLATGLMAGMDIFSNIAESSNTRAQEKLLKDRMSAENLFRSSQGSRGDYDINSGAFRPNQMTPVTYKKGGTYYMDEKQMKQFLAAGGQIEIID